MKTSRGRIITGWRHVVPPKSPSLRKHTARVASPNTEPLIAQAVDGALVKAKE